MIAIIDYGMGNLRSVQKALEQVGGSTVITQNGAEIQKAQKLVLPGVGAIKPAMDKLSVLGVIPAIKDFVKTGRPFLGICLGLQLLFETSTEGGSSKGLGLIPGHVELFAQLKVPHMGWNQLQIKNTDCPLFKGIEHGTNVYFCHSYYVKPADPSCIATTTEYGVKFASAIAQKNIYGVQFHPEKSQNIGLKILKNFVTLS